MPEKLGERIAQRRTALGWTQQTLADRIAVSRTAISHFEMDLAVPSERTIVLLAGVFKCEPHELVDNTYYPTAKATRLPHIAARYTEVEKELCLLDRDLAWLERCHASVQLRHTICTEWLDQLVTLHMNHQDPYERASIDAALQRIRRELRIEPEAQERATNDGKGNNLSHRHFRP